MKTLNECLVIAIGRTGNLDLRAWCDPGNASLGSVWQVAVNRALVRRLASDDPMPEHYSPTDEAIEAELQGLEAEGISIPTCPKCGGVL